MTSSDKNIDCKNSSSNRPSKYKKIKGLDSLPRTCADCKYHICKATIETGCNTCTGYCTKRKISKVCSRPVKHCSDFSYQETRLIIDL